MLTNLGCPVMLSQPHPQIAVEAGVCWRAAWLARLTEGCSRDTFCGCNPHRVLFVVFLCLLPLNPSSTHHRRYRNHSDATLRELEGSMARLREAEEAAASTAEHKREEVRVWGRHTGTGTETGARVGVTAVGVAV